MQKQALEGHLGANVGPIERTQSIPGAAAQVLQDTDPAGVRISPFSSPLRFSRVLDVPDEAVNRLLGLETPLKTPKSARLMPCTPPYTLAGPAFTPDAHRGQGKTGMMSEAGTFGEGTPLQEDPDTVRLLSHSFTLTHSTPGWTPTPLRTIQVRTSLNPASLRRCLCIVCVDTCPRQPFVQLASSGRCLPRKAPCHTLSVL